MHDAARGRRQIDRCVTHAAGYDELQSGRSLEDARWKRRAFAHHHDHVRATQRMDELVVVFDMMRDEGDIHAVG